MDSEVVMLSAYWEKKRSGLLDLQDQLQQIPVFLAGLESTTASLGMYAFSLFLIYRYSINTQIIKKKISLPHCYLLKMRGTFILTESKPQLNHHIHRRGHVILGGCNIANFEKSCYKQIILCNLGVFLKVLSRGSSRTSFFQIVGLSLAFFIIGANPFC